MAKKPSERRNYEDEDMELNLTPMMNLISLLIPCLLISMVFVEIATINVTAPAIGSASDGDPPEKPDKPPLNLVVTITDKGYTLAASGGVLPGVAPAEGGEATGPTIPLKTAEVGCIRYVDTVPPPRAINGTQSPCADPNAQKQFQIYDNAKLTEMLVAIKDAFPDEQRVTIAAESSVEFEALTDAMDAAREQKEEGGTKRELFPEVVLSPGLT